MSSSDSRSHQLVAGTVKHLAQFYVKLKKPTVVAVAGSVGKTSTKLMLAHLLSGRRVSYMDDSYNNGLGLYLSVFEQKIPTNLKSPIEWSKTIARCLARFASQRPEILIVEYGIDHLGDMDDMVAFIRPDVSLLTAVTPEHMEYMKTIDQVGEEETKILRDAKKYGVYNAADVAAKYIEPIQTDLVSYGNKPSHTARYEIKEWLATGAVVDFTFDDQTLAGIHVKFISEPLIRQLTGAALTAAKLGVPASEIANLLASATPAASRMRLFDGKNDSNIIDDTTNFSPDAGVEALKALKRLPAKRRIAILGNMHELGEYADKGFSDVAKEFGGVDILVLVGDLSKEKFGPLAMKKGFVEEKNLFYYDTSVEAGIAFRDKVAKGDMVLVKGPFGGFYLEEAVKKLLKNASDSQYLTRQSEFWQAKKQEHFGEKYLR